MSGTSADGVDASVIQSNGDTEYKVILDKYFVYNQAIYENIHKLKEKINDSRDLTILSKEIQLLEKEITLFHTDVVKKIFKKSKLNIDLIGFHGQTIFHNAKEKISKQLGDGKLLSKLAKKTVIYDFRQNDLKNGGQGAPLTPIFHKLLKIKFKIKNSTFINIGGITNITSISKEDKMSGTDVGPGMCLIDRWIRQKSKKKYDKDGIISKSGKVNKKSLDQLLENFNKKEKNLTRETVQSFDTKYFDFSLIENLSLEDGATTLMEFTAKLIMNALKSRRKLKDKLILCGGGRKNFFLVNRLKKENSNIQLIDQLGVDGDFIESQAFGYLAIRSYLKLPISFPETTNVKKPCQGGVTIKY
jgi:anhydro-N-acetylmuramic acid kinase